DVMKKLIAGCVDGASVLQLCKLGDELVLKETATVFKKEKEMKKGRTTRRIGFPTCISVNNCVCHNSPLESEKEQTLHNNDLVKIDLAVHIDGFIAAAAHTLVVGCTKENPATGRHADVVTAAHLCAEAALRLVKAGNKTNMVTQSLNKVSESFQCKPVEGMLSHQLQHNRIDGEKTIILNPTEKQRQDHEESEFEVHEVYAVDCLVSSGGGHPKELDTRTTVYKRNPDVVYQLKMKASRITMAQLAEHSVHLTKGCALKFDSLEIRGAMGIVECCKHGLCTMFPVMWEKEGELVAQFKFTVLLMPNMPMRITDSFYDPDCYKSSFKIEDAEILNLLNTSTSKRAAKKKKKKAATKAAV
uniref:Peptidase M24 domain-containing protein n=1 Tax=Ciona savignyi TaxID=51511 RepID=H2YPS3_CIOSA